MKRLLLTLLLMGVPLTAQAVSDDSGKELCKKNYESYKDRLNKNPEDSEAWKELRVCSDLLSRWNIAAQIAEAATLKKPDLWEPHLILGLEHYHDKRYLDASGEYKKAIELKKDQPMLYSQLALAYIYLRQPEDAKAAGLKAVELAPTNSAYHRQLAFSHFLLHEDNACELQAKKAIELDRDDVAAYKILGNLYQRQGKQEEADKMFEEAIHANGRQAGVSLPSAPLPAAVPGVAVPAVTTRPAPPEPEPGDTEGLLKNQWEKMKQAAKSGDIEKALAYFSDYSDTRSTYRQSFQQMGPQRMQQVFSKLQELSDCDVVLAVATCKASVNGGNGTLLETTVRFERNDDHVWRVKSF